ncbi:hypothetical protein QQS21_002495 [Conoideocrella luteorostrata]|uniref:Uncharacterized protein n=1 Tax=Conoideocrella luteorostrata TaxID=1105319 RepID=A0AAJ0CXK3_9HYPO|nr:hypothetical protein QQS21_002495 [Conoideocrella luteorostrata]
MEPRKQIVPEVNSQRRYEELEHITQYEAGVIFGYLIKRLWDYDVDPEFQNLTSRHLIPRLLTAREMPVDAAVCCEVGHGNGKCFLFFVLKAYVVRSDCSGRVFQFKGLRLEAVFIIMCPGANILKRRCCGQVIIPQMLNQL